MVDNKLDVDNTIEKIENEKLETKKDKIPKELMNNLTFNQKLSSMKEKIDQNISELKEIKAGILELENLYNKDIKKLWKGKKKRQSNGIATGFVKQKKLPEKLAKLINVPYGTMMSTPTFASKFCSEVLVPRNLVYDKDRAVYRADAELLNVFNIDKSVNNSTSRHDPNGFNFLTLQKLVSKEIKSESEKENKSEKILDKNINIKISNSKSEKKNKSEKIEIKN